jgi:hypothetical protein
MKAGVATISYQIQCRTVNNRLFVTRETILRFLPMVRTTITYLLDFAQEIVHCILCNGIYGRSIRRTPDAVFLAPSVLVRRIFFASAPPTPGVPRVVRVRRVESPVYTGDNHDDDFDRIWVEFRPFSLPRIEK